MRRLFDRISTWIVPCGTLVIWAAAPPISGNPSGALLVPEVDFLKDSLRMDVICANAFAAGLLGLFSILKLVLPHGLSRLWLGFVRGISVPIVMR